jgi:hypothetical protein
MVIIGLIIVALVFYYVAKKDEEGLDKAKSQADAVVHGGGSMLFTLVGALAVLAALLVFIQKYQDLLVPR